MTARLTQFGQVGLVLAACTVALTATASRAHAGNKDFLKYLPTNPTMAGVVNLAQGKKNPLFVKAAEALRSQASGAAETMAKLGVDVASDVTTVSCGAPAKKDDVQIFVCVLDGNFTKAAGLSPAAGTAGVTVHEGINIIKAEKAEYALVGKRLLVTSIGEMPAAIDRGLGKAPSAANSKKAGWLASALGAAMSGRQLWVAGIPDADQNAKILDKAGAKASWMSMSLKAGDPVMVEMRAKAADATAAETMVTTLTALATDKKSMLSSMGLKGLADSMVVDRKDALVRFAASAPAKEIETIVNLAKMLR